VLSFLTFTGKGADKNKADTGGYTPLIKASVANQVEVVRLLIDAGAEKDSVTRDHGFSALHFAASSNHVEVARFLVEAGANRIVPSSQMDGFTALDLAVTEGHTEVVELLS